MDGAPLLERTGELDRLEAVLRSALGGRGAVVEMSFLVATLQAHVFRLQGLHGEWDAAIAGLRGIADTRGGPEKGSLRYAAAPLARLLARRGAEDAPTMLAWSGDLARRADCYWEWMTSGLAEIETAWLTGRPHDADEAVARLDDLTALPGREVERGELNRWKRRLGLPHEVPPGCPELYAAGIRGDWRAAAAAWEAVGAPYEQALELIDSGEPEPTRQALQVLDGLGADAAAARVRRDLRADGVSGIPAAPRRTTREHPAGLTARQVDVLRLLGEGITNAEIAERLVISEKTADHHVSAILAKLDVRTRREAAAVARDRGLLPERRRAPGRDADRTR